MKERKLNAMTFPKLMFAILHTLNAIQRACVFLEDGIAMVKLTAKTCQMKTVVRLENVQTQSLSAMMADASKDI